MKEKGEDIVNQKKADELIVKLFGQTISDRESELLSQWLEEDGNRQYFDEFVEVHYLLGAKQRFYPHMSWSGVKKNVTHRPKKRFPGWAKYAAAAVVLLAAGYMGVRQYDNPVEANPVAVDIDPGYEKATLVLSDGTQVALDEHQDEVISEAGNTQIQNTASGLVYNTKGDGLETAVEEPAYNTLIVPIGGVYRLMLPDGSRVWLNSASSLRYPEKFVGDQRIVNLEGEAYFEVTKGEKEFIVQTKQASVAVLGTQFNVSAYKDDAYFSSTLVEGRVSVSSDKVTQSVIMEPGQRSLLEDGGTSITVSEVETDVYTAWREGKFYFERTPLEHIMVKVSRWYDVQVTFESAELKEELFTGVVYKNKSLGYLLDMMSRTTQIQYEISNNPKNQQYEIVLSKN